MRPQRRNKFKQRRSISTSIGKSPRIFAYIKEIGLFFYFYFIFTLFHIKGILEILQEEDISIRCLSMTTDGCVISHGRYKADSISTKVVTTRLWVT